LNVCPSITAQGSTPPADLATSDLPRGGLFPASESTASGAGIATRISRICVSSLQMIDPKVSMNCREATGRGTLAAGGASCSVRSERNLP
jgi:hypothetical protein